MKRTMCLSKIVFPASTHASDTLTDASVGYVVFGQSLKMHSLRHVLRALGLEQVEPEAVAGTTTALKIAFDGCDPEACAAKAVFARSLPNHTVAWECLGVGRVPQLWPVLASQKRAPDHQGGIFDPTVEVFRERWVSSLHRIARFSELRGLASQAQWISAAVESFAAVGSLTEMLRYTSNDREDAILRGLLSVVQSLETNLTGLAGLARSENGELMQSLAAWNRLSSAGAGLAPAGALYAFRELVCGLGLYGNFETAVSELAVTPITTLAAWKEQLENLR